MKKYYTPEIEEFYVGFEFESNYVLFNKTEKGSEWEKIILDDSQFGWFYSAYTNDAVKSEFRVKYLDKEDIESLGFKLIEENFYYKRYCKDKYILRHYGLTSIIIQDEHGELFDGDIKNKSELKKLFKQLTPSKLKLNIK